MSFMIRHEEFGIYQGEFMGFGFWHPMSEMPEQGLCKFEYFADAQDYTNFLCSAHCAQPLKLEDLTTLPFDEDLNTKLLGTAAFDRMSRIIVKGNKVG